MGVMTIPEGEVHRIGVINHVGGHGRPTHGVSKADRGHDGSGVLRSWVSAAGARLSKQEGCLHGRILKTFQLVKVD